MCARTLMELEGEAIQLADYLHSEASLESKRGRFFQFFQNLAPSISQSVFCSYYLQYAPFLPLLSQDLIGSCHDPEELHAWLDVMQRFKEQAPEHLSVIDTAEHTIRLAAILSSFYAADFRRAAGLLDLADYAGSAAPALRWDAARHLIQKAPESLRGALDPMLREWEARATLFPANSAHVVLIDSYTIPTLNRNPRGIVLALHAEARERPDDADADFCLINNQTTPGHHSLYWTMMDGLLAARAHMAPGTARRFYTVQYSLAEKSAEVSGSSMGLAAALLAWVTIRNRHYRHTVVSLSATAAITGGIRADGTITAVDSLSLGAKISAAFFSPVERLFLPAANMALATAELAKLEKRYPDRHLYLQPIRSLGEALQDRNLVQGKQPTLLARVFAALQRSRHKQLCAILTTMVVLALLIMLTPALQWWRDRAPARWQITENSLVVQNKAGQKLWSHRFDFPISPEAYNAPDHRNILIDDLDQDGRMETLIGISESAAVENSGTLYGFDDKGRLLWPPVKLGALLTTQSGVEIEDRFNTGPIITARIEPGQPKMILCTVGSLKDFAARLVLIDHRGIVRGSYWNSGHIAFFSLYDYDDDGKLEIAAGMYGNEEGQARLAVFDPDNMQGASPQSLPAFTLAGIPRANHLRLFRFPKSPFWEKGVYRDVVSRIELWGDRVRVDIANHGILKEVAGGPDTYLIYFYVFSTQMEPVALEHLPDYFISRFHDIFGKSFSPADREKIASVESWDGAVWKQIPLGTANLDR